MKIKDSTKQFLLKLSRQTLSDYFEHSEKTKLDNSKIPDPEMIKEGATFVTLTIDGTLRGCIGSLIPKKKIYQDIIDNTLLAAFSDSRFPQLEESELANVKIEISILGKPVHAAIGDPDKFLDRIRKSKPGMIIQRGFNQATYLPQVWEDLPDPAEFMASLCQKAGLGEKDWMKSDAEIFTYDVERFSEK